MKSLTDVLMALGHKEFNNLVMSMLEGDTEIIHDALNISDTYWALMPTWAKRLRKNEINQDNFPWEELQGYANWVGAYLENELIIPIQ